MKCHQCDEKALFHITEIDDEGDFAEVHLCWRHAQEYMREPEPAPAAGPLEKALAATPATSTTEACPVCKMTFAVFRNSGRLGCPNDYKVFHAELKPLIENVHGADKHVGKAPRSRPVSQRHEALRLRQELQQAVAAEKYELAAELRDRLGKLDTET